MGTFLAGLEADIQGIAAKRAGGNIFNSASFGAAHQIISAASSLRTDFLGTVRGRLGWTLASPNFLTYATGGLAYGRVSAQTQESAFATNEPTLAIGLGNVSTMRTSYTVGAGAEMMLAPNWSVKAEYIYYDLGRVTYSFNPLVQIGTFDPLPQTATVVTSSVHLNGNIARVGLNYQFH